MLLFAVCIVNEIVASYWLFIWVDNILKKDVIIYFCRVETITSDVNGHRFEANRDYFTSLADFKQNKAIEHSVNSNHLIV